MLGYYAGGLMIVPFVQWLLMEATAHGRELLYFLARDGHILQRVYDLLAPHYSQAPRSKYLLASRRAWNSASLESAGDVQQSLSCAFLSGSPESIFRGRFGLCLDDAKRDTCRRVGLDPGGHQVFQRGSESRTLLLRLIDTHVDDILEHAKSERGPLLQYLGENTQNVPAAVVDIGHGATMQQSLQSLLSQPELAGYYVATFESARGVSNEMSQVRGWLGEFINPSVELPAYCGNIGLFEFLFLNSQDSLSHFEIGHHGREVLPVFIKEPASERQGLVETVHQGVVDFTQDLLNLLGRNVQDFYLAPSVAARTMMHFATAPSTADASILAHIKFFDGYAGGAEHQLIALAGHHPLKSPGTFQEYLDKSWWKPGALALLPHDGLNGAKKKLFLALSKHRFQGWGRRLRKNRGLR